MVRNSQHCPKVLADKGSVDSRRTDDRYPRLLPTMLFAPCEGVIFDGFRTIPQAEALKQMLAENAVSEVAAMLELDVLKKC